MFHENELKQIIKEGATMAHSTQLAQMSAAINTTTHYNVTLWGHKITQMHLIRTFPEHY